MLNDVKILLEVAGLYRITLLNPFRKTPGVVFDNVPTKAFPRIDAIDRVLHIRNAASPGPVGDVGRPWYMHPHQDDNLVVLQGTRHVELYTHRHGRIEEFAVTSDGLSSAGKVISEGAAMLSWPRGVFHRVRSAEEGSVAINFAVHHEGIDMRTNFNIYDVDLESGRFWVIREAHLDQP